MFLFFLLSVEKVNKPYCPASISNGANREKKKKKKKKCFANLTFSVNVLCSNEHSKWEIDRSENKSYARRTIYLIIDFCEVKVKCGIFFIHFDLFFLLLFHH